MKLAQLPCGLIDWMAVSATEHPGDTGAATMRSRIVGDFQLRFVDYSAGYLADHSCDKGHIMLVVEGALTIEYRDGGRHDLTAGMSWHVADNGAAAHRVFSKAGAKVFIVD